MLVLKRKLGQRVWIGENISVKVVRLTDGSVRLGFEAPKSLRIMREELLNPGHEVKELIDDPNRD